MILGASRIRHKVLGATASTGASAWAEGRVAAWGRTPESDPTPPPSPQPTRSRPSMPWRRALCGEFVRLQESCPRSGHFRHLVTLRHDGCLTEVCADTVR